MKLARRNPSVLARRNPLSEKQIWNRSMVTGAIGGVIGFSLARSTSETKVSGTRLAVGFVAGFVTAMSIGALAFGASTKQLPRIVFGFPRK